VREALPEVLVPDWPVDPRAYVSALGALDCFDAPALTDEDRARGAMYAAERQRTSTRGTTTSVEEWLAALELVVTVEPLRPVTLTRATQLLNKTNQMNLTTRRFSESSLAQWAEIPGNAVWTVSVADRFGTAGLTGVFSVTCADNEAALVDLVLSCRVFGRKVEEAMLHVAVGHAADHGARSLSALPVATAKNKPTFEFLRDRSGLQADASGMYRWDCRAPYPLPSHIRLERVAVVA
jgi:FkbH-like protein